MTDKKSRRVVIINNIKSDSIDQAIFILKASAQEGPKINARVVQEAQDIIDSYIRQVEFVKTGSYTRKKRKRANSVMPVALVVLSLLCMGLSWILLYFMR